MKFTKGDWVVCLPDIIGGGAGYTPNKMFKIDKDITNTNGLEEEYVAWGISKGLGVYFRALRKATFEEIELKQSIRPILYEIY